jgi:hypothetical protein
MNNLLNRMAKNSSGSKTGPLFAKCAVLVAIGALFSSGCCRGPALPVETISGEGISKTIARDDNFDLVLNGANCRVVVQSGTVRSMSVKGNGHEVAVNPEAKVLKVSVSGNDNLVRLPDGSEATQVTSWGNGNTVD